MTISILGYETFSIVDPVLTIPLGCTNVVCYSTGGGGSTIQLHGNPMSLIVAGLYYGVSLSQLQNPPIGSVDTETDASLKTFVYLGEAGACNAYDEKNGTSEAIDSMTVAANEILIIGGFGTADFYLSGYTAYFNPNYCAYKIGAGAAVNYGTYAPDYGTPPFTNPGRAQMVAARFPTSSGEESTFFSSC